MAEERGEDRIGLVHLSQSKKIWKGLSAVESMFFETIYVIVDSF